MLVEPLELRKSAACRRSKSRDPENENMDQVRKLIQTRVTCVSSHMSVDQLEIQKSPSFTVNDEEIFVICKYGGC